LFDLSWVFLTLKNMECKKKDASGYHESNNRRRRAEGDKAPAVWGDEPTESDL